MVGPLSSRSIPCELQCAVDPGVRPPVTAHVR